MSGPRVVVTGIGTVNSVARNASEFAGSLRDGRCGIAPLDYSEEAPVRAAAQVGDFEWPAHKGLKNAPRSARLSAAATAEAIEQSGLGSSGGDRERIGLLVAGSNLHQELVVDGVTQFIEEPAWLNPRYALTFLDTFQVGLLTEMFAIHGPSFTVGGASASGNVALIQAFHSIRSGLLGACVVVGASADITPVELQALATIGAASPGSSRPFDASRDGFVWGQGSGAVVLETEDSARRRDAHVLAELSGGAIFMDGNHLTDSSRAGEARSMTKTLDVSGLVAANVEYLNAHATASRMGDETECAAIRDVFEGSLDTLFVNSTKSLIGHCLSAAGVIEAIACILQMEGGFLHPNLGLDDPIDDALRFTGARAEEVPVRTAMSNGFGFGGFNTSIILKASPVE